MVAAATLAVHKATSAGHRYNAVSPAACGHNRHQLYQFLRLLPALGSAAHVFSPDHQHPLPRTQFNPLRCVPAHRAMRLFISWKHHNVDEQLGKTGRNFLLQGILVWHKKCLKQRQFEKCSGRSLHEMALVVFLTFYLKFRAYSQLQSINVRTCVSVHTYPHIHTHRYMRALILGFIIYLDCLNSFNSSITFLTKLSLIWAPWKHRDRQNVACCVGGWRGNHYLHPPPLPGCSAYAEGQTRKAALRTWKLCTVGKDKTQNHRKKEGTGMQ